VLTCIRTDLEASREVSSKKAQQFCQEYGMEMLETSAKSGENVLAAFEKLIGIVHDRALAASKNKGGINGMHTASTTTSQAQQPIKLDDKAANDNSAAACGC
jgi:hypothetical protein